MRGLITLLGSIKFGAFELALNKHRKSDRYDDKDEAYEP